MFLEECSAECGTAANQQMKNKDFSLKDVGCHGGAAHVLNVELVQ